MPSLPSPAAETSSHAPVPGWRELGIAWALALLVAALPLRGALLSGDHVLFAVDTVTTQLPWAAALPEGAPRAPGNPDLSDQGTVFYPFYRWVSESWRSGDPPAWCPLVYAGAPGFGNAQAGAFDPQVLALVALDALGGKALFDRGLALVAWLRVAVALAGAFALARRLGLGRPGAALAALSFGWGGFLSLWLNHPLGHVAPYLPWLLFFLEGLRGPRRLRSAAAAGLALTGAILGGHVETAFFVGAAGGAWALALWLEDLRSRAARALRLGSPGPLALGALALGAAGGALVLLPTLEYLDLSAAKAVREASAAREHGAPDLVALGLLLVALGAGLVARRAFLAGEAPQEPPASDPEPRLRARPLPWSAVLGLALALFGTTLLLVRRGFGLYASLALVPDRLGAPSAAKHYAGAGNYIEAASAWVPFVVLALALAALLGRGSLRRRGLVAWGGLLAFLLAVELPGLLDAYRVLPLVGLGATVRLAVVSSLFLGLLAGDALESLAAAPRVAAVLALLPLVALGLVDDRPPALAAADRARLLPTQQEDDLVGFVQLPEERVDGTDSPFEVWVHPGLPLDGVRLALRPVSSAGELLEDAASGAVQLPLEHFDAPTAAARRAHPERVDAAPLAARWLRTPYLLTSLLETGFWHIALERPPGADGSAGWSRPAALFQVERSTLRSPLTLGLLLAAALLILWGPTLLGRERSQALLLLVALLQGAAFGRDLNPVLPRAMAFEETATERILARELGGHRFQADPGVLPADSGLVRGLRHVEGYDALDPKDFNDYRSLFLPSGVSPLLAWNARALDHDDPAYRLLGVAVVAMREPWSHPRFDLVASPSGRPDAPVGSGEEYAETWIYRDRDPLPRAFVVDTVVTLDEIGAVYRVDPAAWDPLESASIEGDWRPETPFTTASVSEPEFTNNTVRLRVDLDGDGLLVLTEQYFPGWQVTVDGRPAELHRADVNFRGVALEEGQHEVVFRYAPRSFLVALILSGAALTGLLALGVAGLRRPDPSRW